MFKFLKDKLKGAISKFSKNVDDKGTDEVVEESSSEESQIPSQETHAKPAEPISKEEDEVTSHKETLARPIELEEEAPRAQKKKGFFSRITEKITTKKIDDTQFDELFWDLEIVLLENNVAVQVIEKIKNDLREQIVDTPIARTKIEDMIMTALKRSVHDLFIIPKINLLDLANNKSPLVICFIGINGSGKTTTIAKMAKFFQDHGKSVVIAAADTFRAAAIDQLQIHADKLGVKLIKHEYGADAAAVAFDAIAHAKAKGRDIVLIDTAGRLHSNTNLVDEMKKIVRVANPDLKIFVGESITGNDCIEQAIQFDEAVGLDGIILSKADIDEKGGAAVSVSYVTRKPILYLGTGQEYTDLEPFDADAIVKQLFA